MTHPELDQRVTVLFGILKIRVLQYEKTKNLENHSSEDRRSGDLQFEDVKFTKSED